MNEMVERVAHALMAVTAQHECGDLKLKHHYEMARAAIAAMREPTEVAKSVGIDVLAEIINGHDNGYLVGQIYCAMIDALKDA